MADVFTKQKRREIMQAIKSKGTKPEMRVCAGLNAMGYVFETHRGDLPGRPDFVFRRQKVVVMVEGCFWHGCPTHYKMPKSNRKFWHNKIVTNMARDRKNQQLLKHEGWGIIRVWECATRPSKIEDTLDVVHAILKAGGANA